MKEGGTGPSPNPVTPSSSPCPISRGAFPKEQAEHACLWAMGSSTRGSPRATAGHGWEAAPGGHGSAPRDIPTQRGTKARGRHTSQFYVNTSSWKCFHMGSTPQPSSAGWELPGHDRHLGTRNAHLLPGLRAGCWAGLFSCSFGSILTPDMMMFLYSNGLIWSFIKGLGDHGHSAVLGTAARLITTPLIALTRGALRMK